MQLKHGDVVTQKDPQMSRGGSGLLSYEEATKDFHDRPAILLGNGASRAVWEKFAYNSLFDLACQPSRDNHLTSEDVDLFQAMDSTTNFELVLSSLAVARRVNGLLGIETGKIERRYNSVRLALIQAVRDIHVPYDHVSEETKRIIADTLSQHRQIFTTNYDLLPYWSTMNSDRTKWKDCFWNAGCSFNILNCDSWDETTQIYYLHGALHLYHRPYGPTCKIVGSDEDGNILSQFDVGEDKIPLFISEGTSEQKMQAINSNDYLTHAFRTFCNCDRELVVFGHGLDSTHDDHIVRAIAKMKPWKGVAVSIYPGDEAAVTALMRRLENVWDRKTKLRFFDSTTHPLGAPQLQIREA
jgi:hypothetical protein